MQKTVLITGCSSGIGLCAAKTLTERGYRVLAACRKDDDLNHMKTLGLEPISLDLNNPISVENAALEVIKLTNGRLYGLFNNAGFGVYGALSAISRQQMEAQFSTNFFGLHQLTTLLLPAMIPHGEGRIIQTSSVMGIIATPGRGAYAASKYAVEAWSDALRMEIAATGVKVSLIEPGPIHTCFSANVAQVNHNKPVNNPSIASRFTLTPDDVVKKLIDALENPKPKLRYPVTLLTHVVRILKRFLPDRLMDVILNRQSDKV